MSEIVSNLIEGSKVAKSMLVDLKTSVPCVMGLFAASVFLANVSQASLPKNLHNCDGIFAAIAIFLFFYFLLLWWFSNRSIRQSKRWLKQLAEDEKIVLRQFLHQKKAVGYFSIENGAAFNLVNKGILTLAMQSFHQNNILIAMQPLFFQMLLKKPSLIGVKPDEIGSKEIDKPRGAFPNKNLQGG